MPELYTYLTDKILSIIWTFYIAKVGNGFYVSRGTRIRGGGNIYIGKKFQTGQNLWLDAISSHINFNYDPVILIGDDVSLSNNVHVAATTKIVIGNGVLIGSNVIITDHMHGFYSGEVQDSPDSVPPIYRELSRGKTVVIGSNVWIGDGVAVLPGIKIGDGSIIGANSVVTKSIPPNVIAVGSPAVPIKKYDSINKLWTKI